VRGFGDREAGAVRRTLALVISVGLVVGGGWWLAQRPGPDLALLRDDPLAGWVPDGATLERSRESESGTTLGKPRYARVTRIFTLGAGGQGSALDEAQAAARDAGWTVERRSDDALTATRDEPDWRLDLIVVADTVRGVRGDFFVYLTAYPA
jgi:hypothetical protein